MTLEHIKHLQPDAAAASNVLLVHGACMGAWVWQDNFLPFLFDKGFNVHAISLRNHGGSSSRGNLRFTSIREYVEDIKSIVEELEGEVYIVGHSMGGFVVQHYLSDLSPKIRAVVLLCSVPNTGLWQLVPKLLIDYPLHFLLSCLRMSWLPMIRTDKRLKKLMFGDAFPIHKMKALTTSIQEESFLAFLEMVFLRLPKIKKSPIPMMIIGADQDYLIPVLATSKMAKYYKVEAVFMKDASHCLMLEPGWQTVADKLVSFFHGLVPSQR